MTQVDTSSDATPRSVDEHVHQRKVLAAYEKGYTDGKTDAFDGQNIAKMRFWRRLWHIQRHNPFKWPWLGLLVLNGWVVYVGGVNTTWDLTGVEHLTVILPLFNATLFVVIRWGIAAEGHRFKDWLINRGMVEPSADDLQRLARRANHERALTEGMGSSADPANLI